MNMLGTDYGPEGILAVRLIAILAHHLDRTLSTSRRPEKHTVIDREISAVRELVRDVPSLSTTKLLESDGEHEDFAKRARAVLTTFGAKTSEGHRNAVFVEAATSIGYPDKIRWELGRDEALSEGLVLVDPRFTGDSVRGVRAAHRRSIARLQRSAVSLATKGIVVTGAVAVSAASLGLAAPAMGTLIGTSFLGLSGAAATSAGLALMGGGSLASGGLGMAGGALLVKVGAGFAYKGAATLGTRIAAESRTLFIHELAKLDVIARLNAGSPQDREDLLGQLRSTLEEIERDRDPVSTRKREAQRAWLTDPMSWKAGSSAIMSTADAAAVEGSARALRSEIKHLEKRIDKEPSTLGRWVPWSDAAKLADLLAG